MSEDLDLGQCVEHVHRADRFRGGRCARSASVARDGKHYCAQHDPERQKAKRAQWQSKYEAKQAEQDATRAEARSLALALGVEGDAEYSWSLNGYTRRIVIDFADARLLIERLKR